MKYSIWCVHGRFQLLHNIHIEMMRRAFNACEFVYIGITNFDSTYLENHSSDHRFQPGDNPFTFFERLEMIRESLLGLGIKRERFEIVPFPIDKPELITSFVPENAIFFVTVVEDWSISKIQKLSDCWLKTEILWDIRTGPGEAQEFAKIHGSHIRSLIVDDKEYKHLVPIQVVHCVEKHDYAKRLKMITH